MEIDCVMEMEASVMVKKWLAGIAIFLVVCVPVAALGPNDVESLRNLSLFVNGTRIADEALEVNGEYYVPLSMLEDKLDAEASIIGNMMRVELEREVVIVQQPEPPVEEDEDNAPVYGGPSSQVVGTKPVPPSVPSYENYHAGMIMSDLRGLIVVLDSLESLTTDYKTIIYAHLNSITQGKSPKKAQEKLSRLQDDYDYLELRYLKMVRELEKLDLNDRDVEDLVDDLLDDLDTIFENKEEALDRLMEWVDDKDESSELEIYETVDRLANRKIDDVRDYVEGSLDELEDEFEDLVDL